MNKQYILKRDLPFVKAGAISEYHALQDLHVFKKDDWKTSFKATEIPQAIDQAVREAVDSIELHKIRTDKGRESKYFKLYGFDKNDFASGYNGAVIDQSELKHKLLSE